MLVGWPWGVLVGWPWGVLVGWPWGVLVGWPWGVLVGWRRTLVCAGASVHGVHAKTCSKSAPAGVAVGCTLHTPCCGGMRGCACVLLHAQSAVRVRVRVRVLVRVSFSFFECVCVRVPSGGVCQERAGPRGDRHPGTLHDQYGAGHHAGVGAWRKRCPKHTRVAAFRWGVPWWGPLE